MKDEFDFESKKHIEFDESREAQLELIVEREIFPNGVPWECVEMGIYVGERWGDHYYLDLTGGYDNLKLPLAEQLKIAFDNLEKMHDEIGNMLDRIVEIQQEVEDAE